jgi:hypothetical protein
MPDTTIFLEKGPKVTGPSTQEPAPPVPVPEVSQYVVQPTTSWEMGTGLQHVCFSTDATFPALLTDATDAGFSVTGWFRNTGTQDSSGPFGATARYATNLDGMAVNLAGASTSVFVRFFIQDGRESPSTPENVLTSTVDLEGDTSWFFVAVVWDPIATGARRMRLWVNDTLYTELPAHPDPWEGGFQYDQDIFFPADEPLTVGRTSSSAAAGINFDGQITEVCIWDGPLLDLEAAALYGNGIPPDVRTRTTFTTDLLAYYNTESYTPGPSAVFTDLSGAGNHGTDISTTTNITNSSEYPT